MTTNNKQFPSWVCMGSPQITVDFLEYMYVQYEQLPDAVITNPDKPFGRAQILTPSPVKQFAHKHDIPCHTPEDIRESKTLLEQYDVALVFAYGVMLPHNILDAPRYGTVNIHPSLLPEYRGPSPITTAILDDNKHTGVTLMKLVAQMDAGPIIAQFPVEITQWDKYYIHETNMAHVGARLFHDHITDYITNKLLPEEQNHEQASYCAKYRKQDMEISLDADAYTQYRTYCAFPKPFFINANRRFVVSKARYESGNFLIERVIPEGKAERNFHKNDIQ